MRLAQTIGVRLSLTFVAVFFVLLWVGLFGLERLVSSRLESDRLRDSWLYKTRFIGDLNNATSDFRAAEATTLLAENGASATVQSEVEELDSSIAVAQGSYEKLPQAPEEHDLYRRFQEQWQAYRPIAEQAMRLARAHEDAAALAMFRGPSRSAYDRSDRTLNELTALTNDQAHRAADEAQAALRQARWLSGIALLTGSLMVFAALAYVVRAIAAPLRHLAIVMRRLAANETDIDIRDLERRDEIGEMARALAVFRSNAVELLLSQRGLARQASMLEEKLAHERHLTQLQRNFIAMASHEFVTPLTIIDGQAQRLINMKGRLGAEQVGERAGKIRAAVARATHLINSLLASARVTEGPPELYFHPKVFDLADLVGEVCAVHREIQAGSPIIASGEAGPIMIPGDRDLLFQVLSNLLSNSVKYSPEGRPVEVSVQTAEGAAEIVVADHGLGIPADDVERVFDRFYRAKNVASIVGTGVGLYLVKTVTDLHGGTVSMQSEEHRGSRVTLRLPLAIAEVAAIASPSRVA